MIDLPVINESSQGNYFNSCPFIDSRIDPYCAHCNMTTGQGQVAPACHTHNRSGSNIKSNEATALSMTAQPFVPKQVMDIARPMPMNSSSARRNKETNNSGTTAPEYGTYKTMQFQQNPTINNNNNGQQQIACNCCCGNNMGHVDAFLQEPIQQLTIGTPLQTERGRSIDPHRFSQMITPGLMFDNQSQFSGYQTMSSNGSGQHQRSRSAWRTNAQREMDNCSPINQQKAQQRNSFVGQNMFGTLPAQCNNGSQYQQCMNPGCSMHSMQHQHQMTPMVQMMFPSNDQQQQQPTSCHRSRSYEFLDQAAAGNPMTMMRPQSHATSHGQQQNCGNNYGNAYSNMVQCNQHGLKSTKASLPPASHHSPEQRTSYRQ